jgi:Cell division GTPase
MDRLIPIGHLSSITGVSIRTIRYYEEIDLLRPAQILGNNYRYYGDEQIDKLKLVIFLKKMGFALREIKTVLTENNQHSFVQMVRAHQEQLDIKLNEILLKKEIFTQVLSSIGRSQGSPLATITEISDEREKEIDAVMQNQMPVKVIGIGEGSMNAVNKLANSDARMDFIHIASNQKTLLKSNAGRKIKVVGTKEDEADNSFGFQQLDLSMEEEMRSLAESIKDTEVLFIVSYIGEESGSSAATVIAREARRSGILTIGIVVESSKSPDHAVIQDLRAHTDVLLHIPMAEADQISTRSKAGKSYSRADGFTQHVISCLSSLVLSGNFELIDFRALTEDRSVTSVGTGRSFGENRGGRALSQALDSHALHAEVTAASSLIVSITGSPDLTLTEINAIIEDLTARFDFDIEINFAAIIDEELKDHVVITILLLG